MGEIVTIDFHGDQIVTVDEGGERYVALKPIVTAMGLAWHGQYERLKRDPILSEGIRVTRIPSPGGPQDATGLRLDLLNGWLFTIDAARVRKEVRDRVILYQRECYRVLAAHFQPPALPAPNPIATLAVDLDLVGLAELDVKRRLVAEARQTHGPDYARRLWSTLGLPGGPGGAVGRGNDVKAEILALLRAAAPEGLIKSILVSEMLLHHRRSEALVTAGVAALRRDGLVDLAPGGSLALI